MSPGHTVPVRRPNTSRSASVVPGMNESMLTQARRTRPSCRAGAAQARRAARAPAGRASFAGSPGRRHAPGQAGMAGRGGRPAAADDRRTVTRHNERQTATTREGRQQAMSEIGDPAGAGRAGPRGQAARRFWTSATSPNRISSPRSAGSRTWRSSSCPSRWRPPTRRSRRPSVASTLYVPGGVERPVADRVAGGRRRRARRRPNDVLVVIGLLLISSPVTGPVPKRIYVVGSVLAPRGSEQVLGQALAGGTGSVSYYAVRRRPAGQGAQRPGQAVARGAGQRRPDGRMTSSSSRARWW